MAGHRAEGSEGDRATYDPRREARRQLARVALPDDVQAHELDREARKELLTLAKDTAETVARHLVMAGRLMDEDPVAALAHARAARALAGRVAVAREANGLVAYAAGEWAEALTELRTARRISGDPSNLPVIADCERALGRPDRALMVTEDPQAAGLDAAARVELLIVASGARRDLGHAAAAAASLQVGALEGPVRPWTARLRYAYADALLDSGREDEARQWFSRAAEVDPDGETDAVDRLLELDGIVLDEVDDGGAGHEHSDEASDRGGVTAHVALVPAEADDETDAAADGAEQDGASAGVPAPEATAEQHPQQEREQGPERDRLATTSSQPSRHEEATPAEQSADLPRKAAPWQPAFSDSEGIPTLFDEPPTG